MDLTKRTVNLTVTPGTITISERLAVSVNGVIEHELTVGAPEFVRPENKLIAPFDAENQYQYTLLVGGDQNRAEILTIARMGLLTYWGKYLTGADIDETIDSAKLASAILAETGVAEIKLVPTLANTVSGKPIIPDKTVTFPLNIWEFAPNRVMDKEFAKGITGSMIFLHMKDVGMLVSANLVRTGHHYIESRTGPFVALERKRFSDSKDSFTPELRGILYHEAMHPFLQTAKLMIYNQYLHNRNNVTDATTWPVEFRRLDPVVTKRLPVAPAGSAWLAAALSILYEIRALPSVTTYLEDKYGAIMKAAKIDLDHFITTGKTDTSRTAQYEGMAAFAHGILSEIAAQHSAVKAPSLSKIAEGHIGTAESGKVLGRQIIRGEFVYTSTVSV